MLFQWKIWYFPPISLKSVIFMIFLENCNFSNKDTKRESISLENLIFCTFQWNLFILVIFTSNMFSLKSCTPYILVTGLKIVLNWSRILSFLENSSVFSVKVVTFEKGKTPFCLGKFSVFRNQTFKALWKYIVLLYSTKKSMHFSVNDWSLKLRKTRKEIL